MLKLYFLSLRLAFALVLLGVSLVFVVKHLGFLPDSFMSNGRILIRFIALTILGGIGAYAILASRLMNSLSVSEVVAARVRRSLDAFAEGLVILDENQRIVLVNRSAAETLGMGQEKLIGLRVSSLNWNYVPQRQSIATQEPRPWTQTAVTHVPLIDQCVCYQHPDRRERFFSVNTSPIEATETTPSGVLVTFRDVTDAEAHRAEMEETLATLRSTHDEIQSRNLELQILATRDALTGCLNRRVLFDFLGEAWARRYQNAGSLACLMFDNDHFKKVNDSYGHQVGDTVLQRVAEVLQAVFEAPAVVCRYGGEEFCVVLENVMLPEVVAAAEDARERIESLRFERPAELRVSVSIGLSLSDFGSAEVQDLIHQADRCLYEAKEHGRNRVVVYSEQIKNETASSSCRLSRLPTSENRGGTVRGIVALLETLNQHGGDGEVPHRAEDHSSPNHYPLAPSPPPSNR